MLKEPQVMKAPNVEVPFDSPHVKYPLYASIKLDGMRIKVMPDGLFSLVHKKQSQALHIWFKDVIEEVKKSDIILDCEVWSPKLKFNQIMSAVANPFAYLEGQLTLCVFDTLPASDWYSGKSTPFSHRVDCYRKWVIERLDIWKGRVLPLGQHLMSNHAELLEFYNKVVSDGGEGLITRTPTSLYKHGRATVLEGTMFKWKKWVTVDAQIIGFRQATVMTEDFADSDRGLDELGRPVRSTSKGTRELVEGIGSVEVRLTDGTTVFVGATKEFGKLEENKITWDTRNNFIGRWVEIRYQESGTVNKPRIPGIVRFRPDKDGQ
jgi:hypothetical protein